MRQIGGEFVFDKAGNPTWCHRMEVRPPASCLSSMVN